MVRFLKKMFIPAAAFFVALSLLFAGCGTKADGGYSYFVQLDLDRSALFVDGENLSLSEYRELMSELKTLVNGLEEDFSVEFPEGDIARINAAEAGEIVRVSGDTYAALSLAFFYEEEENGCFSPTLFPLTELWGFSPANEGSYGVSRGEPEEGKLAQAKSLCDPSFFVLGEDHTVVKSVAGAKLDLGGIAKGYMCDRISSYILQKYQGHTVDGMIGVMSNTVLLGKKIEDGASRNFNVAIENPRDLLSGGEKSSALFLVGLSDVSVTTSSDNYRFYVNDGKVYPHIIDAKTGKPADRGIISVTAVVPDSVPNAGAFADSLTTAVFCMPLTEAIGFLGEMSEKYGVGAVVITSDHKYYAVGDVCVMDRGEYAAFSNEFLGTDYDLEDFPDEEEVFVAGDVASASDTVVPCEKEKEYIAMIAARS